MKTKSNWERIEKIIITIAGLALFAILLYGVFKPVQDSIVTFNVVGITNSTNSTSLVSVHFECIKYCSYQFHSDSSARNSCYTQCENLGREGCK